MADSDIRYEPCVVSFIDVLGFRNLLATRSAADIHGLLKKLEQFTRPEEDERTPSETRLISRAFSFVLSDAIVRVRPYDTHYHDGAFFYELIDLLHAQVDLIANGVIIRAGVAVDDAYVGANGEGPPFGPAFVRAYEIESQEAIFPRIVIDEHAVAEHRRDPRLRAEHNTIDYELGVVASMLATGEDGTRYLDYLRASRTEFDNLASWLAFLSRHAELVRSGLSHPGNGRVLRKFEWLARYHDRCVAELQIEATSSNEMTDELYEDGAAIDLPSFVTALFVHPNN